ncbi:MAG: hypothetical protein U0798_02770 [Gemmataceae bacterium]
MNEVNACRAVLIEVLTILSKDLDKLAIVGGWVPELAFPNKGHIGSLDVDLALDARTLVPKAYESIRKKLADAGYQQSPEMSNRFFRTISGTSIQVKVDLITGEFPEIDTDETHHHIQEMTVWKARGVDLAFTFQQDVIVEGTLPEGGHNKVTARMPIIAAYLCIKAITLSERKKEKDAYDICFCIEHYHGGYQKLAEEFRGKTSDKLIAEGIGVLREKFERVDSIGPVWAAMTAEQVTAGTGFNLEMEQRRAYEIVQALLRQIDQFRQ